MTDRDMHAHPADPVAWLVLRSVLGVGQMLGAAVTAWALIKHGVTSTTLEAAAVTTLATLASRVIFHEGRAPGAVKRQ